MNNINNKEFSICKYLDVNIFLFTYWLMYINMEINKYNKYSFKYTDLFLEKIINKHGLTL